MSVRLSTHLHRLSAAVALAGLLAAPLAQAQAEATTLPTATANRASIATYVAQPSYRQAQISPNGTHMAVLAPVGGKLNLVALDLATMKPTVLTSFTDFDVINFSWAGTGWLVLSLGRINAPTGPESGDGGGLFAVSLDGKRNRVLATTIREQRNEGARVVRYMRFLSRAPGSDKEILVLSNQRNARDIYRVNLDSGERTLLTTRHPGRVQGWLVDAKGVPRVAVVDEGKDDVMPDAQERRVLLRDSLEGEWREVAKFPAGKPSPWAPLSFAENDKDLVVSLSEGRDTSALAVFDVTKQAISEVIAAHPRYDLGLNALGEPTATLLYDHHEKRLVGLRFADETVQTAYFDPALDKLQRTMEASFPGKAVTLQPSDSDKTLVTVLSDRSPTVYYLFDQKRRALSELLRSRDDLTERHLVAMRPFLLKTRDGLEIPSYYFLPADYKPGQKLPTVVHVHGGPMVRADTWGPVSSFGVREAQLLASRGYAVVLPNFRITPGFGKKIYEAGFGEVGRKMSEDHEDAAQWAIDQGFADANRLCISGASYGGYATLWALIKSKPLFKCGVAGLVVSDYERQLTSLSGDTAYNDLGASYWRKLLGQKEPGWAKAHEVSPARHAKHFEGGLFIYEGQDDIRTPVEQAYLMVDALKKEGKAPDVLMVKPGEGHGYGKVENNIDLYTQVLKFLDKYIGTGPSAAQ